jgi:hypothetical protein
MLKNASVISIFAMEIPVPSGGYFLWGSPPCPVGNDPVSFLVRRRLRRLSVGRKRPYPPNVSKLRLETISTSKAPFERSCPRSGLRIVLLQRVTLHPNKTFFFKCVSLYAALRKQASILSHPSGDSSFYKGATCYSCPYLNDIAFPPGVISYGAPPQAL